MATTDTDVTISVNRTTDALTYSQIEQAARNKGMEIDEFIIASAAQAALAEALHRSWEQGQRGEWSDKTMADIRREARAEYESKQQS